MRTSILLLLLFQFNQLFCQQSLIEGIVCSSTRECIHPDRPGCDSEKIEIRFQGFKDLNYSWEISNDGGEPNCRNTFIGMTIKKNDHVILSKIAQNSHGTAINGDIENIEQIQCLTSQDKVEFIFAGTGSYSLRYWKSSAGVESNDESLVIKYFNQSAADNELQEVANKVIADGSESTIIEIESTSNILSIIPSTDNDFEQTGSFEFLYSDSNKKYFKFQHPVYVNLESGQLYKSVKYHINIESETCIEVSEFELEIYRTPVILIHGWISSSNTFISLEDYLIESNQYANTFIHNYDYSQFSDDFVLLYLNQLNSQIDYIISNLIQEGFSLAKADIIGHSMGGLYIRAYVQHSREYREKISRIITINTPHKGSEWADCLVDEAGLPKVPKYFYNHPITQTWLFNTSAVHSMRTDSRFIRRLISSRGNCAGIYKHAIGSLAGINNDQLSLVDRKYETWYSFTNERKLMERLNEFSTNCLTTTKSDLIVSSSSQSGGLNRNFVTFFKDLNHNEVHQNLAVHQRIIYLLGEDKNLSFTKSPYK